MIVSRPMAKLQWFPKPDAPVARGRPRERPLSTSWRNKCQANSAGLQTPPCQTLPTPFKFKAQVCACSRRQLQVDGLGAELLSSSQVDGLFSPRSQARPLPPTRAPVSRKRGAASFVARPTQTPAATLLVPKLALCLQQLRWMDRSIDRSIALPRHPGRALCCRRPAARGSSQSRRPDARQLVRPGRPVDACRCGLGAEFTWGAGSPPSAATRRAHVSLGRRRESLISGRRHSSQSNFTSQLEKPNQGNPIALAELSSNKQVSRAKRVLINQEKVEHSSGD